MRILLSTYETEGLTGNYRRISEISSALSKAGHACSILSSSKKHSIFPRIKTTTTKETHIESIGVLPRKVRGAGYDFFDLLFRTYFIVKTNPDFIYCFNPRPCNLISSYFASILLKKPLIFDWADLWGQGGIFNTKTGFKKLLGFVELFLEDFAIKNSDIVTCISAAMVNHVKKHSKKALALYLPVAPATDLTSIGKNRARKKLGLATKSTIVGFVYTDSPDVALLKKVITNKEIISNKISFIILGPKLFNHSKPNIIFNDFVKRTDLSYFLSCCDFTLLPFSNKKINLFRNPNKIADYLKTTKPFITQKVGEPYLLIRNNNVGWAVSKDATANEFSELILKIAKNKKEIQTKERNIALYNKKVSWESLIKPLNTALKNY